MLERLRSNFKNYFSSVPKAAFIVILFSLCFAITIINAKKTITVVIDGERRQITTFRNSLSGALSDGKIEIDSKDKIIPGIMAEIKNGDEVYIKRAVAIAVDVDGKEIILKSAEANVVDMLKAEKITLDENDKITPAKDEKLHNGLKVAITRVAVNIEIKTQNLDFATEIKSDDNLEKGVSKILQDGVEGSKTLNYKVICEDGKEVSRNLVNESVTQKPVNKIVAEGTLGAVNSNRGDKLLYTNSMQVRATAYSSSYSCTGKNTGEYGFGVTATGTNARRNMDGYSSIAVDPRVIPFGTRVYIPGYGSAIAEDTGGAIKGNIIDVYFDTDFQANNWGVKYITVYILKK